jgi:hypothetical protein
VPFYAEVDERPLAWLPATQSGVAWRLLCLDASVRYGNDVLPWREHLPAYNYTQLPALTLDRSRVHTVATTPLYTSQPLMPVLPAAMLPLDPIDLELDVETLSKMEDDTHLCGLIPAGASLDHILQTCFQ